MTFSLGFRKFRKLVACFCVVVLVVGPVSGGYCANVSATVSGAYEQVQILKGDIQTIPAKRLRRVSITDPTIADINEARGAAVDIIGIEPGQAILFIWDDTGKRTVVVRVVEEDLGLVKTRLRNLLNSAGFSNLSLSENANEGKVIITGNIAEDKKEFYSTIIDPFNDRIINMVQKESSDDLIQMDLQITELSTTLQKKLGVDWGVGDSATNPLLVNYAETLPTTTIPNGNGSFKDLFKVGDFSRTSSLIAAVNAMIEEGKAKVLSKPRLVVISGKEATFLVGGEIPIKSTTTSGTGGSSTESVTFKQYGVSMAITPSIRDDGMVNILLSIEVSDIDTTNYGLSDVAFLTRSAHTQLLLDDHQTVVLAGMIKSRKNENTRRVPIVSKVPVVGMLFRSKKNLTPEEETELVISITPTILRSRKTPAVPGASAAAPVVPPAAVSVTAPAAKDIVLPNVRASVDSAVNVDFLPYADAIQRKIASAIAYPYEAQEKGWRGTANLSLRVKKDGSIKSVTVKESSGYPVFDQDAVNTAQILAPYAPFPAGSNVNEVLLTIPIIYSLDAFLKNVSSSK
ncbi:MAG: TonB family protein [Candidatus Omnitrophota bacterium]